MSAKPAKPTPTRGYLEYAEIIPASDEIRADELLADWSRMGLVGTKHRRTVRADGVSVSVLLCIGRHRVAAPKD